jgi:hypothetical protein
LQGFCPICPLASYPELSSALGKASVPDFRGLFLRGYGSQSHAQNNGSTVGVTSTLHTSGSLGTVQGDANRNVTGEVQTIWSARPITGTSSGALSKKNYGMASVDNNGVTVNDGTIDLDFDTSRVVPTSNENRPVNIAVRYLIRAFP